MRKRICLWMVVALLAALLLPAAAEETNEVTGLLDQLAKLLDVREQAYEIRRGALDAVSSFCEDNSYESLLNARIACDEAARALRRIAAPVLTLSDEALDGLMRRGVEVDVLEIEIESMQAILDSAQDSMVMYKNLLFTAACHMSQKDTIDAWLSIDREKAALDSEYDGNFINVLLLPLAEEPEVAAFCNDVPSRWPIIAEAMPQWEDSRDALWEKAEMILDAYEAVIDQASAALGRDAYAAERFSDAMDDLEALRADANVISGMPAMAPLPSGWLLPETTSLYASYGEAQGLPETLTLYEENVALEAFVDYAELLSSLGAVLYRQEEEQDARQMIFIVNGHALILHWDSSQAAMVSYDPRFLSLETAAYMLSVQ